MSRFSELINQERAQSILSDTTFESAFSIAQRFEIANIVAAAMKAIQMQQFISSFIFEIRSSEHEFVFTEFIKK
jgi:hypothetical protein